MRRTLRWLVPVCLLVSSLSFAEPPVPVERWDSRVGEGSADWAFNGQGWTALDLRTKAAYVLGMIDGTFLLVLEAEAKTTPSARKYDLEVQRAEMARKDILNEIIPAIDRFYTGPGSRDIPVIEAYRHVLRHWRGAAPRAQEQSRNRLTRRYAASIPDGS